jgi:hypothetical protein
MTAIVRARNAARLCHLRQLQARGESGDSPKQSSREYRRRQAGTCSSLRFQGRRFDPCPAHRQDLGHRTVWGATPSHPGRQEATCSFAARSGNVTPPARAAAQHVWFSSVTELKGERLPALSTAWTENVFDSSVP